MAAPLGSSFQGYCRGGKGDGWPGRQGCKAPRGGWELRGGQRSGNPDEHELREGTRLRSRVVLNGSGYLPGIDGSGGGPAGSAGRGRRWLFVRWDGHARE